MMTSIINKIPALRTQALESDADGIRFQYTEEEAYAAEDDSQVILSGRQLKPGKTRVIYSAQSYQNYKDPEMVAST